MSDKNLLDTIQKEQALKNKCAIGKILAVLSDSDREGLNRALDDLSIENVVITGVLNERGHNTSDSTISRHRRGVCGC